MSSDPLISAHTRPSYTFSKFLFGTTAAAGLGAAGYGAKVTYEAPSLPNILFTAAGVVLFGVSSWALKLVHSYSNTPPAAPLHDVTVESNIQEAALSSVDVELDTEVYQALQALGIKEGSNGVLVTLETDEIPRDRLRREIKLITEFAKSKLREAVQQAESITSLREEIRQLKSLETEKVRIIAGLEADIQRERLQSQSKQGSPNATEMSTMLKNTGTIKLEGDLEEAKASLQSIKKQVVRLEGQLQTKQELIESKDVEIVQLRKQVQDLLHANAQLSRDISRNSSFGGSSFHSQEGSFILSRRNSVPPGSPIVKGDTQADDSFGGGGGGRRSLAPLSPLGEQEESPEGSIHQMSASTSPPLLIKGDPSKHDLSSIDNLASSDEQPDE